jgi:hypothetical protein
VQVSGAIHVSQHLLQRVSSPDDPPALSVEAHIDDIDVQVRPLARPTQQGMAPYSTCPTSPCSFCPRTPPRRSTLQVLEPQFAHVRALVAYVSHYEKFARYRRFSRPLSRHESIAGSAAARLLHAALIERTSARAVPLPLQQGSATSVGSIAAASDPYAVLPASILEAVRVRARGWWRFAGRCVCSDIRRKAGPAAVSVADFTLKTALRDR